MNTRTHPALSVAVAVAAGALVAGVTAAPAFATRNHDKPTICHPVEGKGETGTGWNLIGPDEASKHIDEVTGAGKHTRKDGRTDVYADAAGLCPGAVVVVPTQTPTPTPTLEPTPEPTPTVTPDPTPTVTASPDPTPTVEPTPDPTPTNEPSPEPTPTDEPTPSVEPTPTDKPSPSVTPTTSSTTSPAPVARHTAPVTRAELAQTGAETWHLAALGILLLAVGVGAVTWVRIVKEGMDS